ncbi:hypothetical protein [Nocardioides houyundeii]|uniref:UGSC family (seleno)protein n=1 Tax=Nocardioides houyundeii TaxID=2045452 RepID=UPI000DF257EE|nr:hypothetical protein [Nocardioides houyundeii]
MSTITVHVPAVTEAPAAAIDLAERRGLEGARLGLVDNGKPRAGALLQMLGKELQETYGVAEVVMISKGSAGIPLDDVQVADLASRVDLAVTGLGDCGACSACSLQDALMLERAGVASTVLITEVFVPIVARFAASLGAPGYHSLVVPHPVATKDDDWLHGLARSVLSAATVQLGEPALVSAG